MPIFMLISGYLYGLGKIEGKYQDKKAFLLKKAKRLGVPYLFWGTVMLILMPNYYSAANYINGFSHLWFLYSLAVFFLIVSLCGKFLLGGGKVRKLIVFLLSLIFSAAIIKAPLVRPFLWQFNMYYTIKYFPVFYLGVILPFCLKGIEIKKNYCLIASLVGLSVIVASLCLIPQQGLSIAMANATGYVTVVSLLLLSLRFALSPS